MSDEAPIDPRDRGTAPAVPLDTATVRALARVAGYAALDDATIERMAAGAASAVLAVRASVGETLFDVEPAQFGPELERLAAER
jgi:hypothetical protein